ncbi:tyrosine-protein kinase SYK-like [Amphiura filiformis]|uniref:tyrosine-protein kinase SYK-like n=1 Tax=Amphiura filiformis TaxID=82378 RepID=UPI003B2231B4
MTQHQIQKAMSQQHREQFVKLMKSLMHKEQPWFHGILDREEAEQRIIKSGLQEGKFLVRERKEVGSFALSLCFQNSVYHYRIDKDCTGQLSIKDGPKFDTLLMMVDHYEQKKDGLLCTLGGPCSDPRRRRHSDMGPSSHQMNGNKSSSEGNLGALRKSDSEYTHKPAFARGPTTYHHNNVEFNPIEGRLDRLPNRTPPSPPYIGASQHDPQLYPPLPSEGAVGGTPPVLPPGRTKQQASNLRDILDRDWGDEPTEPATPTIPEQEPSPRKNGNPPPIDDNREYPARNAQEDIYNEVAKSKQTKKLDYRNLDLAEPIGKGNFGSVLKGTYKMQGRLIPVAVKTLKTESGIPNSKPEIIKEAEIMAGLDHPHIVRMIGICEGAEMMLVLELAELGPLHKYLKKHTDMSIRNVLELMLQVARGMQYLEEEANFVHRDLAARNVLLVDETFAKISDFGMSKALGLDSQYYVAETAGKWPLKWYAPECIYRFRFSSKSDVWSYGVTLWEALSYGKKPYANMKGQELMQYIEKDQRLHKPERCPEEVYELMRSCWLFNANDRPTFRDIVRQMTEILSKLRSGTLRNYHYNYK